MSAPTFHRVPTADAVSPPAPKRILVTEPHNVFLARQEQTERAYEEIEEARRR